MTAIANTLSIPTISLIGYAVAIGFGAYWFWELVIWFVSGDDE
jgi:hypothetical protein